MRSNYKRLGDYIAPAGELNKGMQVDTLLGISNAKYFQKAKTNTIGINLEKYRIVRKGQFAFNRATTRNGDKISIALREDNDCIVSPSYRIFEVIKTDELIPEYLMMWFRRPEFDRYARYKSHGSAHEFFEYDNMCEVELPIPSIEKQKEIVKEYHTITDRIKLNEQLNQKLENTAQSIYKEWFVNFEFPDDNSKPYKSNGGEMVYCDELDIEIPNGWSKSTLSKVANILMGQSPSRHTYNQDRNGEIFYQGRTEFGFRFPTVKTYTTEPKRMAKKGDVLMSVRAPVGDVNIAGEDCCIGRGVGSLSSKIGCNSFIYYLMQNIQTMFNTSNDGGTVFGSITKDELHDIEILKPLDNVIKEFENIVQSIDNQIKLKCNEVQLLQILRETLLSKMATIEG